MSFSFFDYFNVLKGEDKEPKEEKASNSIMDYYSGSLNSIKIEENTKETYTEKPVEIPSETILNKVEETIVPENPVEKVEETIITEKVIIPEPTTETKIKTVKIKKAEEVVSEPIIEEVKDSEKKSKDSSKKPIKKKATTKKK